MKPFLNPGIPSAVIALFILFGCATTKHTETFLTAAGFKLVMVTTPKQEQRLKSLPPRKISTVRRNGKTYYIFPDAAHHRIYLGTLNEYQNYQQMVADSQIADQNRMSAETLSADGDDWNDWGSWEVITFAPD
jgi:hypothetical protein